MFDKRIPLKSRRTLFLLGFVLDARSWPVGDYTQDSRSIRTPPWPPFNAAYLPRLALSLPSLPPPRVFVLIHKMDLVSEENRETVFMNRKQVISDISGGVDLSFFMTSIWDETLYKVSCRPFHVDRFELTRLFGFLCSLYIFSWDCCGVCRVP